MKYLLGLDNGGTIVKAAIFDMQGKPISVGKNYAKPILPRDYFVERPYGDLWQANVAAIGEAVREAGIDPHDIAAVGVTGHGNGLYAQDANGGWVGNGILSADMRAKDIIAQWERDGTVKRNYPAMRQLPFASQVAPLLLWIKNNDPGAYERIDQAVLCKDYVRYCLTGELCTDETDISGVYVMNLETGEYDRDVLASLGLEDCIEKLPRSIAASTQQCGRVHAAAAADTGLAEGTPVCGGLFDVTSCAIATGVLDEEKLCIVIGTWSINECISRSLPENESIFVTSRYCLPGYYLLTEGSVTGASNLQWFLDTYMREEEAAARERQGSVFDTCDEMLESIPFDETGLMFLPFLFGTNVHLSARAGFIGMLGRHTKAHMLRSIYEGVSFSHKQHVDKLRAAGCQYKVVRLSGGGAASRPWVQMFADVLGAPMEVPEAKELGAMGAAMCAGVMLGEYKDLQQAADVFTKIAYTVDPIPARMPYYAERYEQYSRLIKALDPMWEDWR